MLKKAVVLSVLLASLNVSAGAVEQVAKISKLYTYGTYGTNDTRFRNDIQVFVESPIAECSSYYLSADDAQNNPSLVSFLLSAFHSNIDVRFAAYDDQLWDGSGAKVCRIINIALFK